MQPRASKWAAGVDNPHRKSIRRGYLSTHDSRYGAFAGSACVACPSAVKRRLGPAVGIAEQNVRDLADARREGLQDPPSGRPVVCRVARAIGPGLEALPSPPPLEFDGGQLGLEGGPELPVPDRQVVLEPGPIARSPRRLEAVA